MLDIMQIHQQYVVPALILLFIVINIISLATGLIFVDKSRNKYLLIWFVSLIVSSLILFSMLLMPNVTQNIINFFMGMVN